MQPGDVLDFARAHGVRMVDFKFTDLPGTWQHLGLSIHALDEDAFAEGLGFDGSSIRGFQEIAESDMILVPDAATAVSRHAPCAVVMVQPGEKRPLVQTNDVG